MSIADRLIAHVTRREPDVVIGGMERPYVRRWWLTPWRRWTEAAKESPRRWVRAIGRFGELAPNVYLHQFLRSDDDQALHDHPWANCSIVLRGAYTEHTIAAGGVHHSQIVSAGGGIRVRLSGRFAHRIELHGGPCWTLFVTGPRYREWGFHCPAGWVHWKNFTAADDPGAIGKGCNQ